MVRYFEICFDSSQNEHDYYFVGKESTETDLNNWSKIDIDTKKYDLYKKVE
jgi:hypothetical protein